MKYCFPQDVFPISLKHHWLSFSFWDHPLFVFLLYLEYSHCTLVNYMCFISLSIFWSPREQGACPIHLCISKATQHRAGIQYVSDEGTHLLPYSILKRQVCDTHTVSVMAPVIQVKGEHLQSSVSTGCCPLSSAKARTSVVATWLSTHAFYDPLPKCAAVSWVGK